MFRLSLVPTLAALSLLGCGEALEANVETADPMAAAIGGQDPIPDPSTAFLPNGALFDYTTSHTFAMDDILGAHDGLTAADDPTIVCTTGCEDWASSVGGFDLYPVDSTFGFHVVDFVGSTPKVRDDDYLEGWIGDVGDGLGAHWGVAIQNAETASFRSGFPNGAWCGGLGGELVKCSSEHWVVTEHVLTCDETIPYMFMDPVTGLPSDPAYANCIPLDKRFDRNPFRLPPYQFDLQDIAVTSDVAATAKDDGKLLFRWGTWDKRPTDVRLYTRMTLPAEWSDPNAEFEVTRAVLAVVHTISNNPNDQIRPEDLENEAATGRKPRYDVQPDGTWTSSVDCYEGDGDLIPAGTVLKNPAFAHPNVPLGDISAGFTNAWYTTMDRDPFQLDPVSGSGPRWRLKSNKFGQDLPALEIPLVDCTPPPIQQGGDRYTQGELTTTIIDLLDAPAGEDSVLRYSSGWRTPTVQAMSTTYPGVTVEGTPMTEDFDLSVYIKGDSKAVVLYSAHLYLDYQPVAP